MSPESVLQLGIKGQRKVAQAIRALDPNGSIVTLDTDHPVVHYSNNLVLHENLATYEGDEEVVRAYVVAWLCTTGGYLAANIELEKRYSIGRPKEGAELDILIKHPDGTPYALIETKSPEEYEQDQDKYIEGQLFNLALHEPGCTVLCYSTIELEADKVTIKALTIDYNKWKKFEKWKIDRAAGTTIPRNYGEPTHVHFSKGGQRDLKQDSTEADFNRLRSRLHDILWKGSTPDNTIYAYVVRLFLAKIYDEKNTNSGQEYRFQLRYTGNKRETPAETFSRINNLYLEAYERYLNPDGTSSTEALKTAEFTTEQIAFVVELMQGISLTARDTHGSDLLGGFFEGITRDGFKQTKGLFFTHANIVYFIYRVLQLDVLVEHYLKATKLYSERLPHIIDAACGSGTFLLAAMNLISTHVIRNRKRLATNDDVREFLESSFPVGRENSWAKDFLYGLEQSELLAMASKVNMILRRDGNAHIFHLDALSSFNSFKDQFLKGVAHTYHHVYSKPVTRSFDVAVSNPPFSITLDPNTVRTLDSSFELADDRNSENLFLERWYQLLKPRGRLGVVLPESFYSTKENLNARLFLFGHFTVKAIVSLPRLAFEPWTPTRTSLLFAQKKTEEQEKVWKEMISDAETYAAEHVKRSLRSIGILRKASAFFQSPKAAQHLVFIQELGAAHDAKIPSEIWRLPSSKALREFLDYKKRLGIGKEVADKKTTIILKSIEDTLKKVHKAIGELNDAGHKLKLSVPSLDAVGVNDIGASKDLAEYESTVRSFDVRVWAFGTTARKLNSTFRVVSVEDIGFKRTKRAEYERLNSLFCAVPVTAGHDSSSAEKPILNLNQNDKDWQFSDTPDDAASWLRSTIEWD